MYMYVHDVGAYMYMQGSYQLIVRKLTVYRQYKLPVQLEPTLVEECHARFEVPGTRGYPPALRVRARACILACMGTIFLRYTVGIDCYKYM